MNLEALVENVSWASVGSDTTMDHLGRDVVVVVAKVAYQVSVQGVVRSVLAPVRHGTQGDEGGGIRFPADLEASQKPGTDVGLVGVAYPQPRASDRGRAYAWLSVGSVRKVVTVFGPRVYVKGWRGGVSPSEPAPLVDPVPLRFDLAYGGTDPVTGAAEPHNPIGIGFASDPAHLIGRPAPLLEPAAAQDGGAAPNPAHGAFAPIPAHWEPRRSLIGTLDAAWVKGRAPVRPRDFDLRHHAWSIPGLYCPTPLVGDEQVEVGGVLPEGLWRFRLPKYAVRFESVADGLRAAHATHLDTLLIDADTRVVELCWRASIVLPRKWERIERISVLGVGELPEDVIRGPRQPVVRGSADPIRAGGHGP